MPEIPDSIQMRTVARRYYLDGISRQKISAELNIDPRRVATLLEMAINLGVVRIDIRETAEEELTGQLQTKYPHLQKVMIAPGSSAKIETKEQCDDLFRRFAIMAADYFEEIYNHHPRGVALHVGVTGGMRLLKFAQAVPELDRPEVHVHQTALIGHGPEEDVSYISPILTSSMLWTRCSSFPGKSETATVLPYDIKSQTRRTPQALKTVREAMENAWNNTLVQKAVKNMHGLDVVFGGIGGYGIPDDLKTRLTMEGFVQSIIAPEKLIEQGAAGDYSYCTYDHIGDGKKDRNGNDAWRFFITAGHDSKTPGIEFFKNMAATPGKKVVAIGGPYLTPAIKAALKGKICNVIILDEYSAKEIVAGS